MIKIGNYVNKIVTLLIYRTIDHYFVALYKSSVIPETIEPSTSTCGPIAPVNSEWRWRSWRILVRFVIRILVFVPADITRAILYVLPPGDSLASASGVKPELVGSGELLGVCEAIHGAVPHYALGKERKQ